MTDENSLKIPTKFRCIMCHYDTSNKKDYNKHLLTQKHKNTANTSINPAFQCNCGKVYKHRQSLFNHKQKCSKKAIDKDELILTLTKQTAELQTQVIELCKNGITHTTNNNTNTFNLNFFLNDTCKDAMNLEDFINSLVWQIADLKMVGELGYVKGVSKLITDKLSLLSEDKRPIHCTDVKREVMYVRDDDKWEKEQEDNPKLHRAVKRVSRQESVLPAMAEYRIMNPGYNVSESKVSTEYQLIISEALCGGDEQEEVDTIVKNISKKVIINKTK